MELSTVVELSSVLSSVVSLFEKYVFGNRTKTRVGEFVFVIAVGPHVTEVIFFGKVHCLSNLRNL